MIIKCKMYLNKTPKISKRYSGKYLITEIMWDLTLKQCKTNLKVIKDSYHNELEMYEADVDILREVST